MQIKDCKVRYWRCATLFTRGFVIVNKCQTFCFHIPQQHGSQVSIKSCHSKEVACFSVCKPSPARIIILLLPSSTLQTEVLLNKKFSLCSVVNSIWMCCQHTGGYFKIREGGWGAGGAPRVPVQYYMFKISVRRHLANPSSLSVSISATITWHHMEQAARLESLSPKTFSSRSKCRNDTDYTRNLTQDRNKMSAVASAKSGEKILLRLPQVICLGWLTYRSRSTRKCVSNLLRDSSVVTQLEDKEVMRLGFRYIGRLT